MNLHSTAGYCPSPTTESGGMGDGDDTSSVISNGVCFQEELEEALEDRNFSYPGSFYHASLLPSAPNPYFAISGLGIVGLPLNDRDARRIISCATLAPFGKGERTLIDKDELDSARISFANHKWAKYIKDEVCVEVCKSLGVDLGDNPPQLELYKLLLYEKGSHFLPHQDTQKANGMFATIIIVLPSAYTGGQVVLSHSSMKKTIDFSKDSPTSTALLAWYTDVKHEVKEVTSGYRLALSYNLVNIASARVPRPTLPDMSKSPSLLRKVLKKWLAKKYDEFEGSDPRVAACLLKHEYSPENLKDGLKALKGTDAHKVSFIHPVAEELGFMVGIASLNYYETGEGDDYGGYRPYYHDDYDDEYEDDDASDGAPNMVEVESTKANIEGLVDSDGLLLLSEGQIDLDDNCLIPKHAFKDVEPDDVEYEGYLGNQSGNVEHWYQRTALVLIRKSEVDDICYEAGGVSFAFERLKKSSLTSPTDQDRRWAMCLLQKHMVMSKLHALTLIDYAFKWKELDIWKGVMKCPTSTFENIDTALLLEAWKLFSFEAVCLSFEEFLARSRDLQERIQFIYSLPPQCANSERQKILTWCRKESNKILSSYNPINMRDIPVIMSIIRTDGLEAFARTMMPNLLKKTSTYDFLLALRKALFDERQSILDCQADPQLTYPLLEVEPQTTDEVLLALGASSIIQEDLDLNPTATLLNRLAKLCLDTATMQWFDTDEHRYQIFSQRTAHTSKIKRIIEIIEHAVGTNDMDLIKTLLTDILKAPGEKPITFIQIYTPLIPHLKTSLAKMDLNLEAPPYISFIQILIGSYLCDVLGAKIDLPPKGLRKIGCGCGDCKPLDAFILNPTTTTTSFPMAQMRRSHLEQRITSAGADLCTFTTIKSGSPHTLEVKKRPEIISACTWVQRKKAAKIFLASIGTDTEIARIMGARYPEVKAALKGTHLFGAVRPAVDALASTSQTDAMPTLAASHSGVPTGVVDSTLPPTASSSSTPGKHVSSGRVVAGTKRKSDFPGPAGIPLGPVIDLTGDDDP